MRNLSRWWLALAFVIAPIAALAVGLPSIYGGNAIGAVVLWLNSSGNGQAVSALAPLPVTVNQNPTTWQANMALAAATSTPLTSGNVTVTGTLPAPGGFAFVYVHNIGSNPAQFCALANTCSATTGDLISAGAARWLNVTGSSVAPSFFSPLGTSLAVDN